MSLKGKVALVTGSTSGIGLGIARALGAEGADLMLNGFGDAAMIEKLRAGMAKELGVRVAVFRADISKSAEIAAMVAADAEVARCARYPGEQRRHPVRRQYRGISRRTAGIRSSPSTSRACSSA